MVASYALGPMFLYLLMLDGWGLPLGIPPGPEDPMLAKVARLREEFSARMVPTEGRRNTENSGAPAMTSTISEWAGPGSH